MAGRVDMRKKGAGRQTPSLSAFPAPLLFQRVLCDVECGFGTERLEFGHTKWPQFGQGMASVPLFADHVGVRKRAVEDERVIVRPLGFVTVFTACEIAKAKAAIALNSLAVSSSALAKSLPKAA